MLSERARAKRVHAPAERTGERFGSRGASFLFPHLFFGRAKKRWAGPGAEPPKKRAGRRPPIQRKADRGGGGLRGEQGGCAAGSPLHNCPSGDEHEANHGGLVDPGGGHPRPRGGGGGRLGASRRAGAARSGRALPFATDRVTFPAPVREARFLLHEGLSPKAEERGRRSPPTRAGPASPPGPRPSGSPWRSRRVGHRSPTAARFTTRWRAWARSTPAASSPRPASSRRRGRCSPGIRSGFPTSAATSSPSGWRRRFPPAGTP